MKKMKSVWTLLFILILLCSLSAVAYAASPPELVEPPAPPALTASSQGASAPMGPLPESVTIPKSSAATSAPVQPEMGAAEEAQAEAASARESGNTPYYAGAVFAVLLFIGVALYCKFKGNGNR